MCVTTQSKKTSKNSEHGFSEDFAIVGSYAQRNELLKTEAAFSNICEPITFQEAERRILRDGEATFALSQEDKATTAPPASTRNPTLNTVSKETSPNHTADTSPQIGITSPQGWILISSPPRLFMLKILAKNIC